MKTYNTLLVFTIASALLLSSLFKASDLLAVPPQNGLYPKNIVQHGPRVFSVHDIDQNGSLNREEYQQFIEQIEIWHEATGHPMRRSSPPLRFEVIDTNDDGYLTEDEMISTLNKRLQKQRRYRYRGGRY